MHISKRINLKIKTQQMAEQWWRVKIQLNLLKSIIRKLNKNGKKVIISRNSVYPFPQGLFPYISLPTITTFPDTSLILTRN